MLMILLDEAYFKEWYFLENINNSLIKWFEMMKVLLVKKNTFV